MNQKAFVKITASIFLIIFALHLLRILSNWEAQIGGWSVPFWLSWLALILSGYLTYQGFKISQKS